MRRSATCCLVVLGACANYAGGLDQVPPAPEDPEEHEHDARFVGLWAVTQPYHALYEQTLYTFHADGRLELGPSIPDDCSGHLSQHCVTGSVANCRPASEYESCRDELTCVFGDKWHSLDSATLVIVGDCSDDVARAIQIAFNPDSSGNAQIDGAGAQLVSVAGDVDWSHDNWQWAFQRCPDGDPATCPFDAPLP